jgi:hypothetical protein
MLLKDAVDVRAGTIQAKGVYVGSTKIWPSVAAFTPASLTGLATWLDAADYLPGNWPNKTAGGATPTFVGSPNPAWAPTTLNGKPVVRFTVSEGRVRSTWSGDVHTWTLIYVVRQWGPNVGRAFSAQYPPSNFLVGMHTSQQDWMYDNGSSIGGVGWGAVPGPWKLYGGDGLAGSGTRFYINGVLIGSGSGSGGLTNGWALSGYSSSGTEETCDIEVAELVLYDRRLLDAERQQVETYLRGKWGLP